MPRVALVKKQRFDRPVIMAQPASAHAAATEAASQVRRRRRADNTKPTPDEKQQLCDIFSTRWIGIPGLRELEQQTGKRFKRGKFSQPEKEIIRQGLRDFCQAKGLSQQEFVDTFFTRKQRGGERYDDKRFKAVFVEVAQRLEGRPVLLVYQCMRRMFHPGNLKGKWSEEDDKELKRLFLLHGPDWETIGLSMGRYGMSVRDRYKLFRNRGAAGPWTDDEVVRLRDAVARVRSASESPSWLLVSEQVGTRSVSQCMVKWILLDTLARNKGQRPRWTRELDYHLVCRIYDLAVEHESEIRWNELADEGWPVYFHSKDLRLRFKILRKRVRNDSNIAFESLLEALVLSLRPLSDEFIADSDM